MKERSKERLAALLMEELLEQLAERENIKRMFADMTSAPMEELLESLLEEFERTIEKHRIQILEEKKSAREKRGRKKSDLLSEPATIEQTTRPDSPAPAQPQERASAFVGSAKSAASVEPSAKPPEPRFSEPERNASRKPETTRPSIPVESKEPRVSRPAQLKLDTSSLELPPPTIDLPILPAPSSARGMESDQSKSEKKPSAPPPAEKDPMAELRKLEEVARKVEEEYRANLEAVTAQERAAVEVAMQERQDPSATRDGDMEGESPEIVTDTVGGLRHKHLRTPCTFSDDEYVYLHGVTLLPAGEEPSATPFMLEEKGIDSRSFVFANDYEGMRFYLSKINPNVLTISKTMMLLLGKQESLQLRGMHENIINDLRGHGIVLPFEFGSVVRGADDMFSKVDKRIEELREALDDLQGTTWWTLNLQVLDSRIASLVGTDAPTTLKTRERDRESLTPTVQTKKYDIKMLEKILKKEKKIAETVHEDLQKVADRSDVDSMIGLGSGSSEDWKTILRASYEVHPSETPRFFHAVTDLQYHHILLELMLTMTGNRDQFSLKSS